MTQSPAIIAAKRYAMVTGANKGIGFEICRQLASNGIVVILTSRDKKRGLEAVQKLKASGFSDDDQVVYHQLNVTDPHSISSLADFIRSHFGKVDILESRFLGRKLNSKLGHGTRMHKNELLWCEENDRSTCSPP